MRCIAHLVLALFVLIPCTCVRAQSIVDDFSDGDLQNPVWQGDTEDFVVENGLLQLMAEGAGTSQLFLDVPDAIAASGLSLGFLVSMDFAPSASNYTEIQLQSCTGDNCTTNGTIRIGGISGSDDRVEVSLAAGGESLELNGATGAVGSQPAIVRFALIRNGNQWTLQTDYSGGNNLQQEATGELADFSFNRFLVICDYTSTRSDKFSFDDFNFTAEAPVDEDPPVLSSASITNESSIELVFSESIDVPVGENVSNYSLSLAGVTVDNAVVNDNRINLNLSAALPPNVPFDLTIVEVQDLSGNPLQNTIVPLTYTLLNPPTALNTQLNEFLADPTPVIGLPNAEYVELYNPTDTAVDASLLSIGSGGSPVALPADAVIPAGGYLVLINSEEAQGLRDQGVAVAEVNLPSLTNSGDVITLLSGSTLLQEITYTEAWYNDPEREDGGYSIEYVGEGADAGCGGSWKSSEDPSGGTPGRVNTVLGRVVDSTPPMVTGFNVTESLIEIFFDEAIDAVQIADPALFSLDNGGTIQGATAIAPQTASLAVTIQPGIIYTLSILPDFSDCSGNFPAETQTFQLAIPAEPEAGDVVINELLFNPGSGGSDFVELFNCSEKVFQIEGWVLQNTLSTSQTSAERTVSATRLFLPGEYLTLSADPDDLQDRYFDVNPALLVDQTLPSLPDDEGNLTVIAGGIILDAFDYSEDLHSQLISDENGVSLERLRQKSATQDDNNWFSAAQAENFATPTRPNSQQRETLPETGEQTFSLLSTTFSPDGDSFEDILELQYTTDRPGFLARIRIFDVQGRPIRTLRQVELLAGSGTIRWDGSNDEGRRAKSGAYVLFIELFNPDGEVREEQLTAVLAGVR